MKHCNVTFDPDGKTISIHAGATVLEAAGQVGIILNTVCGGQGTCGKCAVTLTGPEGPGRRVMACQHRIEGDITVTIEPDSGFFAQQILQHGIDHQISVALGDRTESLYGIALDIGTTTVVARLIDMSDGTCIATAGILNPQGICGDDVISRIAYAETEEGLAELHSRIIECINGLIAQVCGQVGIDAADISEIVAAGNTTMNHLFLELPVKQLGTAPYQAHSTEAHDRNAAAMGLNINPAGNVRTIENIAGFVGSDTTAVALAVGMDSAEEMTLVVDIGTNGEIILGTGEKMYAASCAAGPAFEGGRISQGSRAVEGAIEAVVLNGDDIDIDVISGLKAATARSICGSGLIDAVAVLLDLGVIESSGRLSNRGKLEGTVSDAILARVTQVGGQGAFVLAHNGESDPPVILTQRDIREAQLAIAAIGAGIKLLQRKIGIADSDIRQVLLAGGFGNYIRRESALRIGLLPRVALEKVHFVGNAAAIGAEMVLLSHECRELTTEIAGRIEYVETAGRADFQAVFTESLLFD